jgi:membrane-associated protein
MPHFDLVALIKAIGYIGVTVMVFAESGLLIGFFLPGDSLLFTAGFLASQGYLSIWILAPLAFVAAVLGDAVGYGFGRRVGRGLFQRPESTFFKPEYLARAEAFFMRHGGKALVLARFLPIVRTFTPIVAGAAEMRYPRFALYNVLGGFLWAVGVSVAGYFLGSAIPNIDRYLLPIIVLIIAISVTPTAIHIWRENRQEISLIVRKRLRRSTTRR